MDLYFIIQVWSEHPFGKTFVYMYLQKYKKEKLTVLSFLNKLINYFKKPCPYCDCDPCDCGWGTINNKTGE